MYGYKLNNSYTIYVNYAYLNECRKASNKSKKSSAPVSYNRAQSKKDVTRAIIPVPLDTKVRHKTFGDGKVVESDNRGYISVIFDGKVRKFLNPQAFEMGFLTKVAM